MPGVDAATGTMMVPMWAAGAASAVLVAVIVMAIRRAGTATLMNNVFRFAIIAVVVLGGWIYLQRAAQQDHIAERRSLDERSAALMARAIAPGSALSCLDELAGEAVEIACEKAVFASPEAVASAVSYVTAKLALLADGSEHVRRIDASYVNELAPIRAALELDRFGIVAHVLAGRDGCTVEKCDALMRFRDQSHVLANLRDRTFEEQVTKYTTSWIAPQRPEGPAVAAVAPPATPIAPMPQNLGQAPGTVAPRYDFPSSQSIPPVNIMTNEPPAPRAAAPQPIETNPGAATPVPPRRPPQVRTPSVTVAAPRGTGQPGDTPTDGSVPRPTAPINPR